MQNSTNFAVICNPKTPVELLKLHGHFREESILTFRHSPLSLQRELSLPTQFSCKDITSPLLQSERSAVLSQRCDAPYLSRRFCTSSRVTPVGTLLAASTNTGQGPSVSLFPFSSLPPMLISRWVRWGRAPRVSRS